jgi:hypothetical protein
VRSPPPLGAAAPRALPGRRARREQGRARARAGGRREFGDNDARPRDLRPRGAHVEHAALPRLPSRCVKERRLHPLVHEERARRVELVARVYFRPRAARLRQEVGLAAGGLYDGVDEVGDGFLRQANLERLSRRHTADGGVDAGGRPAPRAGLEPELQRIRAPRQPHARPPGPRPRLPCPRPLYGSARRSGCRGGRVTLAGIQRPGVSSPGTLLLTLLNPLR